MSLAAASTGAISGTAPATAGAVIRYDGLSRRHGEVEALSGLALEVGAGVVLGLRGPT